MSFAQSFLEVSVQISLFLLIIAFLLTVYRVSRGPTLPDRILALDMLVAVAIGFIAIIGVKTGFFLYLDVAIALGLTGFLATIAFSRYLLTKGRNVDEVGFTENTSANSSPVMNERKTTENE